MGGEDGSAEAGLVAAGERATEALVAGAVDWSLAIAASAAFLFLVKGGVMIATVP